MEFGGWGCFGSRRLGMMVAASRISYLEALLTKVSRVSQAGYGDDMRKRGVQGILSRPS